MLLIYLRHGDPIYDPDSLTPLGKRQAEALGHRLSLMGLDRIYVSSSNRARLTAQPTCEILKKEPVILDWMNESHAWEQMAPVMPDGHRTWAMHNPFYIERFAMPEVRAMGREWYRHPAFAETTLGEGILRIQRETDALLQELGYTHDLDRNMYYSRGINRERIALFAHQGFGMGFLSCLLDVPYPVFSTHFDMQHSGMTVVHFPEKEGWVIPVMLQLSNDSHLYRDGVPTCYNNEIRI